MKIGLRIGAGKKEDMVPGNVHPGSQRVTGNRGVRERGDMSKRGSPCMEGKDGQMCLLQLSNTESSSPSLSTGNMSCDPKK